jgi:hypothetical protein
MLGYVHQWKTKIDYSFVGKAEYRYFMATLDAELRTLVIDDCGVVRLTIQEKFHHAA